MRSFKKKNLIQKQEEKSSEDYRKIVPDDEAECVWAEAGIVPYKLCDFNFDCNNCVFDQVIRGGHELVPAQVNIRGCKLYPFLFYNHCHMWARVEEDAQVRIGIDDFGQGLIGQPQDLCLPIMGEKLSKESLRIKGRGVDISLTPPVEGHVVEFNERLIRQSSLLNEYPYEMGWIIIVKPFRLSKHLKKLHYGARAQQWYYAETTRLSHLIADEIGIPHSEAGITIQNGGNLDFDILEKMKQESIKRIIEQFLMSCA
jgi:glycine cleavage system H lipoate-binding protein